MPTPDVSTFHKDGGFNFNDIKPDRVNSKIGIAESGDPNRIYLINNTPQARDVFVKGSLVDSIEQYFEEFDESQGHLPVPLIAVRPDNDVPGSVADPVKTGSGEAVLPTVAGTPTGSRKVILKITKAGAHETAEFRKSVDGGISFSSQMVTPESGTPISLDVGVTATFVNSSTPANTFAVGDTYTFEISGPTASTASKLEAIEAIEREYRSNWIHVVGAVERPFAMSASSIVAGMALNHHLPTFLILEARGKEDSETVPEYFQYIQDEWDPFYSDRVSIVTAEGRYIKGGVASAGGYRAVKSSVLGEWRNAATMLTAKLASGAVNVSAGYVKEMRSLTFSEIRYWDEGYRTYMDLLHDVGLVVLKEYDDYEGIYIARDKIKAHPDSDFKEIPERRRADKMHRILYRESLPFLNADSETDSGSGGLDFVKATVDKKISEEMEQPGRAEITGHEIVLDPDKTFASTGILKAKCRMFIRGRMRAIEWTTSFVVPN
jgi:hypothetical protein